MCITKMRLKISWRSTVAIFWIQLIDSYDFLWQQVQDNHEEATLGAFLIAKMAASLAKADDLDNEIDELLQEFETDINRPLLHTIAFQWWFQLN